MGQAQALGPVRLVFLAQLSHSVTVVPGMSAESFLCLICKVRVILVKFILVASSKKTTLVFQHLRKGDLLEGYCKESWATESSDEAGAGTALGALAAGEGGLFSVASSSHRPHPPPQQISSQLPSQSPQLFLHYLQDSHYLLDSYVSLLRGSSWFCTPSSICSQQSSRSEPVNPYGKTCHLPAQNPPRASSLPLGKA